MDLLRDIIRSERPQFRQLDPARDASAKRRWAKLLGGCDITDLRLRNANDRVSPEFRHGPHAGLPVADLVDSFMSSEERPEDLPPMVAAAWRGNLYVVFGNRRLWALLEFVRRHRPWTDLPVPKVRVIVRDRCGSKRETSNDIVKRLTGPHRRLAGDPMTPLCTSPRRSKSRPLFSAIADCKRCKTMLTRT